MAAGKIYSWYPTPSDTTYRELLMEMLRFVVPMDNFPIIPRQNLVDAKTITTCHRELHAAAKLQPDDAALKEQLENVVLWIDGIWMFLETWCVMHMPGTHKMKDRHNLIETIHYDVSGPDAMFTFVYQGKDYVNVYIDEETLRKKVDMKRFRQTVHYAGRGKKN